MDVQCFKDSKDRVVPKEVAIVALHKEFTAHWIVSPICKSWKLRRDIRKQNNWLTVNHHGLDWYDVGVSLSTLHKKLKDIFKTTDKIYVRGKEKAEYLRRLTTREIIDLEEDVNCPPFVKLTWTECYCFEHAVKQNYLRYSCALHNSFQLKHWLNNRTEVTVDTDWALEPVELCDGQFGDTPDSPEALHA